MSRSSNTSSPGPVNALERWIASMDPVNSWESCGSAGCRLGSSAAETLPGRFAEVRKSPDAAGGPGRARPQRSGTERFEPDVGERRRVFLLQEQHQLLADQAAQVKERGAVRGADQDPDPDEAGGRVGDLQDAHALVPEFGGRPGPA